MAQFKILHIISPCKLALKNNNLSIKTINEEKSINLDQISSIIIDTPECILTAPIIAELQEKHINTIILNNKFLPFLPQDRFHIEKQIQWNNQTKEKVWQEIIRAKLLNQYNLLSEQLPTPQKPALTNITDTIEANYADYYFKHLFSTKFTRRTFYDNNQANINKQLNYIYMILIHYITTQIVAHNYFPQIGIHHRANENHENLACDLVEPFRPIADKYVQKHQNDPFDSHTKQQLINLLNQPITYNYKQYETLSNAIDAYVTNILKALNENLTIKINFNFLGDESN